MRCELEGKECEMDEEICKRCEGLARCPICGTIYSTAFPHLCDLLFQILEEMQEGQFINFYHSASYFGCFPNCGGYHEKLYIAKLDGKLFLIDNGAVHHSKPPSFLKAVKELSEAEAVRLMKKYLGYLGERRLLGFIQIELESGLRMKWKDKKERIVDIYCVV